MIYIQSVKNIRLPLRLNLKNNHDNIRYCTQPLSDATAQNVFLNIKIFNWTSVTETFLQRLPNQEWMPEVKNDYLNVFYTLCLLLWVWLILRILHTDTAVLFSIYYSCNTLHMQAVINTTFHDQFLETPSSIKLLLIIDA